MSRSHGPGVDQVEENVELNTFHQSIMPQDDLEEFIGRKSVKDNEKEFQKILIEKPIKQRRKSSQKHRSNVIYKAFEGSAKSASRGKRVNYDPQLTYVADIEHPTDFERKLCFTESHFWYTFIRGVIIFLLIWVAITPLDSSGNLDDPISGFLIIMYTLYAFDLLMSFLAQYVLRTSVSLINPVAKPIWLFILDFIAAFPLYYFVSLTLTKPWWVFLRCKSSLHLVRLMYEFARGTYFLQDTLPLRVFEFSVLTLCTRIVFTSLVLILFDIDDSGLPRELDAWIDFQPLLLQQTQLSPKQVEMTLLTSAFLLKFLIYMPAIALIMFTYILTSSPVYVYFGQVRALQQILSSRYDVSKPNTDRALEYMKMRWKTRGDYMFMEAALAEGVCCKSTYKAMHHDRNLYALQHCPMLRDFDYHILRYLAQLIRPRVYLKNIHLNRFARQKMSMYYIASGEVHLLSVEDGQTPILKLCAGTCVGSVALLRPYPSSVNFCTGTNCEIYVLKTRDFCNLARKFPKEYRACVKYVQSQMHQAILLKIITEKTSPRATEGTIIWIKRELHRLMGMTAPNASDHMITNVYLMKDIKKAVNINDIVYTKMHLNVLSIKPRDSQYNDLVFIKSTCLWVFQPNSPLLAFMWKVSFVHSIITYFCIRIETEIGREWWSLLLHTIGLICMTLEIILKCMTPLNLQMSRRFWMICMERCRSITFLIDIISVVMSFLSLMTSLGIPKYVALLRLWRIVAIYVNIELHTHMHVQLIFFAFLYFVLWFDVGTVLVSQGITENVFSYEAIAQTMTQGVFMTIIPSEVTRLLIVSILSSNYHLFRLQSVQITQARTATKRFMNSTYRTQSNISLKLRMQSFLNLLSKDFVYLQFKNHKSAHMKFPKYLVHIIGTDSILKHLNNSEFFRLFPVEFVQELVTHGTVETFYENAQILTRGLHCKMLYLLVKGEACTVELDQPSRAEKLTVLNCLEVMFNVPSARHVIALSDVVVVSITYAKFLENLKRFPKADVVFSRTKSLMRAEMNEALSTLLHGVPAVLIEVSNQSHTPSFFFFKWLIYRDTFDEYDYFPSFERLGLFSFVRFLLLRCTFHPEGRFYLCWEMFHNLVVCMGIVFNLLPYYIQGKYINVGYAFNAVRYLDLYLRFHVCYYNEDGILVKHPLHTARYYLSRAFLIDVLSLIPWWLYSDRTIFRSLMRALYTCKFSRLFGFKKYCSTMNYLVSAIACMYMMVVIVEGTATYVFELHCMQSVVDDLRCPNLNGTSPTSFYFTLVYMITSDMLRSPSFNGPHPIARILKDPLIEKLFCVILFSSLFWRAHTAGCVLHAFLSRGAPSRIGDVRKLAKFMNDHHMSTKLCTHVVDYLQLKWRWQGQYDIDDSVLMNMNPSLRRDLLFNIYGYPFLRFTQFSNDYRNFIDFYKNVLLESTSVMCPTHGKFISLNDVDSMVYFVFRGAVDIANAQHRVVAKLLPGSIFGNLTDPIAIRHSISATAKCNTQCFAIAHDKLYNVLKDFPRMEMDFMRSARMHSFFIRAKPRGSVARFVHLSRRQELQRKCLLAIVWLHLILVCYVGNLLNIYEIAISQMNYYSLGPLYVLDVLHVCGVLARFHMPVMNDSGIWCVSVKIIFEVVATNTLLTIDVLSAVPFELLVLLFDPEMIHRYTLFLYKVLRFNRILRMYYIVKEYAAKGHTTSRKQLFGKAVFIFYEYFFFAFLVACILMVTGTKNEGGVFEGESGGNLTRQELSAMVKEQIFLAHFRVVIETLLPRPMLPLEATSEVRLLGITFYFVLSFGMNVLLLCHCYDLAYHMYCREGYIATLLFNHMLKSSNIFSKYIRDRLIENAEYAFHRDSERSMRALQDGTHPPYLIETIMLSCFGDFLLHSPLFVNCHPDFVRQLARGLKLLDIPRGYEVVHKFDQRRCMYFVLQGSVVALEEDDDIIENYAFRMNCGDCFCFLLGLNQADYAAYTFTCYTNSQILELDYTHWKKLLDYFPGTRKIIRQKGEAFKNLLYLRLRISKQQKKKRGIHRRNKKEK